MTIGAELEAQILRYYHVEKWRAGTIARQLHVHHGTVHRVLAQAGLPRIGGLQRPSQIDAYLPFIHDDAEEVSVTHGQPSLCDGVRARLSGQSPPLQAFDLGALS
ncbi:hypothetical protein [Paraburkholderia aspalathi]|uniref:Homeodomain-like domain-containing protein n=1 Tax=Paraburkholderia aspalathi TaxID=1324617 RepID=A0A1I7ELN0_9BURK|nr:hypothetical protein [Paraburkholderia aspalathi]SFU24840.1 hypothetical protein SAMN05192563_103036 [Paraburkholderia aspalathi]